jgi:DNA-binding transcriptional regulator YdaS (Cro superfamily)
MVMHRSLITAGLALALLGGGLGFAAFSQTTQSDPAQPSAQPGERFEGRGRGHGQGLANAAAQLGVSEADLKAALGLPAEPPPRPDLAAAATQLGISETDLREALRGDEQRSDRGQRLANAATELGISEADLRTALGLPTEPPPRPNLATAATELGVSEADLQEALRSSMGRGPGRDNCLGSEAEG